MRVILFFSPLQQVVQATWPIHFSRNLVGKKNTQRHARCTTVYHPLLSAAHHGACTNLSLSLTVVTAAAAAARKQSQQVTGEMVSKHKCIVSEKQVGALCTAVLLILGPLQPAADSLAMILRVILYFSGVLKSFYQTAENHGASKKQRCFFWNTFVNFYIWWRPTSQKVNALVWILSVIRPHLPPKAMFRPQWPPEVTQPLCFVVVARGVFAGPAGELRLCPNSEYAAW